MLIHLQNGTVQLIYSLMKKKFILVLKKTPVMWKLVITNTIRLTHTIMFKQC